MKARMDINKAEPGIYQAMFAADNAVQGFDIDPKLKRLRLLHQLSYKRRT